MNAARLLTPANALGNGIEDSEVFGMIHHELAAKLERILASRVRKLVHEAFQINRILIVVHSAPEVRWDVRVAHRVVDEQVRNRIANAPSAPPALRPWNTTASLPFCRFCGAT
jgi:hypothetical protein